MSLRQKITIFSLTFFLNACWASSLEQKLALRDSWRSTSELVRLCTSTDPDRLAYCEGYIEGATHLWKLNTACTSLAKSDLSFCAGAIDADEKITKALEACKDCDMTRFPDDLKTIMGVCKPDKYHDEHYCSGYNWETENSFAEFFRTTYQRNIPKSARNLGMGHAIRDVGIAIIATGEILAFQPCVQIAIAPKQVRKILLEFIRKNPEQQVNSSAIMILEKALFYDFCPGPTPQGLKPHLENCIKWASTRRDKKLGWRNICNKAVVIEFHSYQDKPGLNIERQVIPGKTSTKHPRHSGGKPSLFTVCPVGYVSSVPFTAENKGDIRASQYSCIRK